MNREARRVSSRVWTLLSVGGVHAKRVPFSGALTLFNMRQIPAPNPDGQGIITTALDFIESQGSHYFIAGWFGLPVTSTVHHSAFGWWTQWGKPGCTWIWSCSCKGGVEFRILMRWQIGPRPLLVCPSPTVRTWCYYMVIWLILTSSHKNSWNWTVWLYLAVF
jgi:hypothetical protein